MKAQKLTDPKILKLKPAESRYEATDLRVPELFLRVAPSGRKTWVVRVRENGRNRKVKVGIFQATPKADVSMTTDQAREEAVIVLAKSGRNGQAAKAESIIKSMPTLDDWFKSFDEKNPNTYADITQFTHRQRYKKYIKPRLGKFQLHEIGSGELEDLTLGIVREMVKEAEKKQKLTAGDRFGLGGRTANTSRQLVMILLKWAGKRGVMPAGWSCPTSQTAQERPPKEDNFIPQAKASDFYEAVLALRTRVSYRLSENGKAADLLLLALYTGARKSNLMSMRWEEINWGNHTWKIPAHKFKTRKSHIIPLVQPAIDILISNKGTYPGNPWVFPSKMNPKKHMDNIAKSWRWVRAEAGIPQVTFHGLRHTLGSWQGQQGVNQKLIAASLGHQTTETTDRYVHGDLESVRSNISMVIDASYEVIADDPDTITVTFPKAKWLEILKALDGNPLAAEITKQTELAISHESDPPFSTN